MMAVLRHPPPLAGVMPEKRRAAPQNSRFPRRQGLVTAPQRFARYVRPMDETDDMVERRLLAEAVAEAEATPTGADAPQAPDTPHGMVRARLLAIRDRLQARLGRAGAP